MPTTDKAQKKRLAANLVASKLAGKQVPVRLTVPKLDTLLEKRLIVASQMSQLETNKRALDDEILKLVVRKTGDPTRAIETDEYTVTPINAENSYILKDALIKNGVKPSIIEKSTKRTPYSYPRISKKKQPTEPAVD